MKRKLICFFILCFFSYTIYNYVWNFYYKIPIELDRYSGCPAVLVDIEGNSYSLKLDLGSKKPLSLQVRVLEKIHKEQQGTSHYLDFRGNKYETPNYIIPSASLHGFSLSKVITEEDAYAFTSAAQIYDSTSRSEEEIVFQYFGRVGLDFFSQRNFFMDCSRSCLIICRNLQDLRKDGYETKHFVSCPFQLTPLGIVLHVETDQGLMRFLVDTGSTDTMIRSSFFEEQKYDKYYHGMPVIPTKKFTIDHLDFGRAELCVLDITPYMEKFIDGLIGMDFLKNWPIFFDFKKQLFYIYLPLFEKHQELIKFRSHS
ncbi:MAG: aspartyl protease family protein [Chlamydiales bacterium]|nr:aspartyl protease family protein [Chlamydiales bacterium]